MKRRTLPFVAIFVSLFAFHAYADWSDNFDGGLQEAWTFGSINATETGPSATVQAGSVDDRLLITDPVTGLNNGAAVGFGVVEETFSDVLVTGTINPTNDNFIAPISTLIARSSVAESTFYAAEVNYATNTLVIFRNDDATTTVNIVESDPLDITFTDSFHLEFTLEGADLTATLFTEEDGIELASVMANDETYASGFSGVLAFNNFGDNLVGSWDDLTSTDLSGGGNNGGGNNGGGNTGGLACDVDGDGDCDATDINALFAQFGSAGDLDFDGNGTIGSEDIDGFLAAASSSENTALVDPDHVLVRGDLNFSGGVDSTDLGLLLNNFGSSDSVGWEQGDIDGSGSVDSTDLGQLLNNFNFSSASSAAVPEPQLGPWMLLIGLLAIRKRR